MKNRYIKRAQISERQIRQLLQLFALDVSALTATKICRLNYRTTHRFYGLMRERLITLALAEARPFAGEVEIDESYFGPRRVRGKRGRGASGKIPVIGLHKRGHHVFVSVVKDCSREQLLPIIRGRVLGKSDVYTDGWTAYDGLVTGGYRHHRVHHHENEFARGKNHVNGIESFWSFPKFRMIKLRGVRRSKFLDHLKECEWRFNHRRSNIYKLLLSNLRQSPLCAT